MTTKRTLTDALAESFAKALSTPPASPSLDTVDTELTKARNALDEVSTDEPE